MAGIIDYKTEDQILAEQDALRDELWQIYEQNGGIDDPEDIDRVLIESSLGGVACQPES